MQAITNGGGQPVVPRATQEGAVERTGRAGQPAAPRSRMDGRAPAEAGWSMNQNS